MTDVFDFTYVKWNMLTGDVSCLLVSLEASLLDISSMAAGFQHEFDLTQNSFHLFCVICLKKLRLGIETWVLLRTLLPPLGYIILLLCF